MVEKNFVPLSGIEKKLGFILRRGSGFTLIELLVVVAIFMTVYLFSYQGFRDNRRLEEFRLANEQLAANIRKAQTMALTGITNQSAGNKAYGVYLDLATADNDDRYLLFEDTISNYNYDAEDTVIETIIFPKDITLSKLKINDLPDQVSAIAIVFAPPKPTAYINYISGTDMIDSASITLTRSNLVGKLGAVDFNRVSGRITAQLNDQ